MAGWWITEARGAAVARAIAPRVSITRLIQMSCVGPRGDSVMKIVPRIMVTIAAKLQVTWN